MTRTTEHSSKSEPAGPSRWSRRSSPVAGLPGRATVAASSLMVPRSKHARPVPLAPGCADQVTFDKIPGAPLAPQLVR